MAKKDTQDRKKIALSFEDLSNDARSALCNLSGYMSVKQIVTAGEFLKTECGEDAEVHISYDNYWGTDHEIRWYRDETDEEYEAQLARNAKIAEGTRLARKEATKKKKENELAELARLKKKYPNLV